MSDDRPANFENFAQASNFEIDEQSANKGGSFSDSSNFPKRMETGCCAELSESDSLKTMDAGASASAGSGMDRFLQKMRNDLMYELRAIKHGEKPVTGQNNREQLQKFMEKHVVVDGNSETSGRSVDTESHRPEAVVVEVQGIIEQRPVSSILQSAAFRRQLENVIRGSIQSTPRRETPTPRPRTQRPMLNVSAPVPSRMQARTPEARLSAASQQVRPEPLHSFGLVPSPRLIRQDSSDSISSVDSFSSAQSSVDIDDATDGIEMNGDLSANSDNTQQRPQENSTLSDRNALNSGIEQVDAPHVGSLPANENTGLRNLTGNDVNHMRREDLVEEISDLLHHRLVSSTLDSEFRATLELLVQDRVSASGTDGQQVQEAIRSLPNSGIIPNDFTHLGIPNPDLDNVDNISVTSFSAHSIPFTQTSTHLSREIQSLKSQMAEMKSMMKLNFELQMDIQRAIRQEVAAAMQSVTGATAAPLLPSQPINDTHCLICLDRHSDSVLYQCGHMCVCYICGKDLISRHLGCPVCRAPIKDIIRAYKTNVE